MGEAEERKQAGTYPTGGPVHRFRVPNGKVAITVDVNNAPPSTAFVGADRLTSLINERLQLLPYEMLMLHISSEFVKTKREGKREECECMCLWILWAALNHPELGTQIREAAFA
jgi:hypothetical protein